MPKIPNPFVRIKDWWTAHDTVDTGQQDSDAARQARFQAEMNRIRRPPGRG